MKFKQITKPIIKNRKGGRKLLSARIVTLTQKLYVRGLTMRGIAARLGIALGSVHNILSGNHPNQTRDLAEVKREESFKLYEHIRRKKPELCKELPPIAEISWMRIRGRKLVIESRIVIAERVNGIIWVRGENGDGKAA